jgi:hypothetical protein
MPKEMGVTAPATSMPTSIVPPACRRRNVPLRRAFDLLRGVCLRISPHAALVPLAMMPPPPTEGAGAFQPH